MQMRMAGWGRILGMPPKGSFSTPEGYYSTLFHEMTHSTGHPKRLAREDLAEFAAFGSPPYAREELVAEMGAAFLCGEAGIAPTTVDNSAAYIQGWLGKLKNDKQLVIRSASQARKAVNHILGGKQAS